MPDAINVRNSRSAAAADLAATNPWLGDGEERYETDTGKSKVGPGYWNDLSYGAGQSGGGTPDAVDVTFDPTGLDNTDATEVQSALADLDGAISAGLGASGPWEDVTPLLVEASWATADATGVWKFPDSAVNPSAAGTVKQTDDTTVDVSVYTVANIPGLGWSFQYDLTIDALNNIGSLEHGLFVDYPASSGSGVAGMGLYVASDTPPAYTPQFSINGNAETLADINHAIGDTHTFKFTFLESVAIVELDGTAIGMILTHRASGFSLTDFRIALYAYGAVTFSNIAISRIPVPTL